MQEKAEFVNHVLELMRPSGAVEAGPMFGEFGIYREGLMLALICGDTPYLKSDRVDRFRFEERRLLPFTYERRGKQVPLSYFQAPEEAYNASRRSAKGAGTRRRQGPGAARRRLPQEEYPS